MGTNTKRITAGLYAPNQCPRCKHVSGHWPTCSRGQRFTAEKLAFFQELETPPGMVGANCDQLEGVRISRSLHSLLAKGHGDPDDWAIVFKALAETPGVIPAELEAILGPTRALLETLVKEGGNAPNGEAPEPLWQWPEEFEGTRHVVGLQPDAPIKVGGTVTFITRAQLPMLALAVALEGDPLLELNDVTIGKNSGFANCSPVALGCLAALGGVFPLGQPLRLLPGMDAAVTVTNHSHSPAGVSASFYCVQPPDREAERLVPFGR